MQELPVLTPREAAIALSGAVVENHADDKMYPVPGQGLLKQVTKPANLLPVIEVQHLTMAPTLKSWLDSQNGKAKCPEDAPVIEALKRTRKNGAPINIHIDTDGFYDRAFSGANGNSVEIRDIRELLAAGLSFGDVLRITKLVCGPNGVCGNPGPCGICSDIRDGCYVDAEFVATKKAQPAMLPAGDPLDEEINLLLRDGYALHGERIMNCENSKSASVADVRQMCRELGKSVIYVLEVMGVYRVSEAESHTALKRGDLGGH